MVMVDAFPGNDEIDLVEFRINYLSPIIEFTVIAESSLTHSGKSKPLYFTEWLSKNRHLRERVSVLQVDLSKCKDSWEREISTREVLLDFILREFPHSHFVLSDLDEIPSIKQVEAARVKEVSHHFLSPTVYIHANWHLQDSHASWSRGVIGHTSCHPGENGGRFKKFPVIGDDPGIHFSWRSTSAEAISLKKNSNAYHEAFDAHFLDDELMRFASRYGIDHLGRFNEKGFGLLEIKQVDELSEIQISLMQWNEHYFRFQIVIKSRLKRFLASLICTTIWQKPNFREKLLPTLENNNFGKIMLSPFGMVILNQLLIGFFHFIKRGFRKAALSFRVYK